jgi:hypothetical protein
MCVKGNTFSLYTRRYAKSFPQFIQPLIGLEAAYPVGNRTHPSVKRVIQTSGFLIYCIERAHRRHESLESG